jgi:hypothetical protein
MIYSGVPVKNMGTANHKYIFEDEHLLKQQKSCCRCLAVEQCERTKAVGRTNCCWLKSELLNSQLLWQWMLDSSGCVPMNGKVFRHLQKVSRGVL